MEACRFHLHSEYLRCTDEQESILPHPLHNRTHLRRLEKRQVDHVKKLGKPSLSVRGEDGGAYVTSSEGSSMLLTNGPLSSDFSVEIVEIKSNQLHSIEVQLFFF